MTSHQQSSLELGIGLIENNVDIYEPERFVDLRDPDKVLNLDLKIKQRPQDITEEDMLFVDYLEHVIANTGSYQLSPFSFNWNHLHRIYSILAHFQRFTRNIPLSSCRLDEIARDPGLAEIIAHFSGATNITSAVEGISERICDALEKSLSTEEFIMGIEALIKAGFNGIKIYYIYTGLENDDDVKEFNRRLDIINQFKHQYKANVNVRVSFTPLHSTLGTPTAYHGSKVAKSLKSGDRVFRSIRAACSQHNVGIRLSAALGSVDVGQIMSMSDRRTQPLIEYIGLNGIRPNKPIRVLLYVPEAELTEAEYMKTQRTQRVKLKNRQGETKYYRTSNTWNFSTERMYLDVNENWLYPKMTSTEIEQAVLKFWKENTDDRVADVILDHMQPNAADKFRWPKGRMLVQHVEDPYIIGYTPETKTTKAKPVRALITDRSIGEGEAEDVKRMLAYLTGGYTFNDVIEDKSALHILPDAHMMIAETRHPGWAFSKYIGAMRASLATTYCHSSALASCMSCGQCNTQAQIRSVSAPRGSMETGAKYLANAIQEHKSYDVAHRLLVAVQIADGYHAAMLPQFLRHAVNRALAKGSLAKWVKPLIYDKSWNSRTPYTFRESHGRSAISGQWLLEISMNHEFDSHRQEDIDKVVEHARKFTGAGWQIERVVRLGDPTNPLSNQYDTVITQHLIDPSEAGGVTKAQIEKLAEQVNYGSAKNFLVTTHKAAGRETMRVVAREVKAGDLKIFVTRTMSPRHISVSIISRATNAHPQSLLAAILQRAVDPKDERIGSQTRVQAHRTRVLGHYQSILTRDTLIDADAANSILCPFTREVKLINVVTGMPFGSAPYEQNPAFPNAGQSVFLQNTSAETTQWWPEEPLKIAV